MRTREELNSLLRIHGGLIARPYHPQLAGSFDWLLREGGLTPVLPGVYAAPEIAGSWQTRAQALALRYHDAVLLGSAAAARISFWPEAPLDSIEAAVRSGLKPQPGFSFTRRHIPAELIAQRGGVRYTIPALTAIVQAVLDALH